MIIQLRKGKVNIKPMVVPEPVNHVFIQYDYEPNTNHLKPILYVDTFKIFEGDRIYVDLGMLKEKVSIRVELLNGNNVLVAMYQGEHEQCAYCVIGKKPIRPDLQKYVDDLNENILVLQDEIQKIIDEGEVI